MVLVPVALVLMFLTACSKNPDSLSAGTVEDLVEELLEESGQEQSFVQIQTGMYELNSQSARAQLKKKYDAAVSGAKVNTSGGYTRTLTHQDSR